MKPFLTSLFLLSNIIVFGQNQIVENAKISDVTLYTYSAEMHYKKNISLKKGKNTIIFTDLTPFIVENSVNVNISDKSVNIITVTDKINHLKEGKKDTKSYLQDSIDLNNDGIELIAGEIEALEREKTLLFNNESIGGVSKGVAVDEIEKASGFFNKRYKAINKELFYLKKRKSKLEKNNKKLELQIKESTGSTDEAISEIILVVSSPVAKNVTIDFRFLSPNAGWAPLYDLKFNGPGKALGFVFRANVFNATNTNWKDVKMKLSTASPMVGFNLPSLNDKNENSRKNIDYGNQQIKFKQVPVSDVISEYSINYNYSIPSDGKPYLVDVTSYEIPSSYSYIVIPKLDNSGFLMANIPNWHQYNLLSGTTSIYSYGTYMGKTFLNTITDNDTLDVYLGKDHQIECFRKERSKENERKIIGNFYVEKSSIEIKIKNNYDKAVAIKLIDQVPVYDSDDKVKMNVTNIENADYDKSEGSLVWKYIMQPKGVIENKFAYTIKAPKQIFDSGGSRTKLRRRYRAIPCPSF